MRNDSLAKAVHAMPGPVFATLDGGQFEDLPAALAKADVKARSLFLGQAGVEAQTYGPWLADIYSVASIDRLLDVIGDKPAAVFWSYPPGDEALYKHLRRINAASVPAPRDGFKAPRVGERRPHSEYQVVRVLFRHWDPRVLCEVLPILDEGQFAHLLGEAQLLTMLDEDGRLVEAPAIETRSEQEMRLIELSIDQVEAIADTRTLRSRRRIAAYLREAAAERTSAYDDVALMNFLERSERSAAALGVSNERALGLWAYMQITSSGDFSQDRRIRELFEIPDHSTPDQRVFMLFDARLLAMKGEL